MKSKLLTLKTKILTSLIFIYSLTGLAQDNWEPIESSSSWKGRSITYTGVGTSMQEYINMHTKSADFDTLISGESYTKLYHNTNYRCAFRADIAEKSLYFIPKDSTLEYLFFDYDVDYSIGDTVTIPHYAYANDDSFEISDFKLNGIDSVLIGLVYYTYWNFEGLSMEITIMERMISYNSFPFVGSGTFETEYELKCYSEADEYYYGPVCPYTKEFFDGAAGLEQSISNSKVEVYPNPFKDDLFIVSSQKAELSLFNNQGKLMLKKQLSIGTNQLNMNELAQGVYVYTIIVKNEVKTGKIIKH